MKVSATTFRKALQASAIIASFSILNACIDQSQFAKVDTEDQKAAYSIGYNFGSQVKANAPDLDINVVIAGLKDGFSGSAEKLSAEERMNTMREYSKRRQEEMMAERASQEEEAKASGIAFLEENKGKEGVMTTESGLQYKVIAEGSGKQPAATDTVKVHYKGTLLDGTEFDSSIKRGEPAQFALNRVIKGWTEGLQLMKEGGKWEFYIPSELAYGPRGSGAIAPHSTLIFEVELLEVVGGEAETQAAE